jgi:hypothetical protein
MAAASPKTGLDTQDLNCAASQQVSKQSQNDFFFFLFLSLG